MSKPRTTSRSTDVIALLERLDKIYGPKPAAAGRPATIVLDNSPVHTSKATRVALAARPHWLTPEWLPQYAPELNDIERDWKTLKTHHLAHKTFHDRDALNADIDAAVQDMNSKRKLKRWSTRESLLRRGESRKAIAGMLASMARAADRPAQAGMSALDPGAANP